MVPFPVSMNDRVLMRGLANKRLQSDSRGIVGALRALLFDSAAAEPWALDSTYMKTRIPDGEWELECSADQFAVQRYARSCVTLRQVLISDTGRDSLYLATEAS